MTETVRCPSCRGAKKVAKLGGIIGDCDTCKGTGKIKAADKPIVIEVTQVAPCAAIVEQVARALPIAEPVLSDNVKVDGKRAVYKRKKG